MRGSVVAVTVRFATQVCAFAHRAATPAMPADAMSASAQMLSIRRGIMGAQNSAQATSGMRAANDLAAWGATLPAHANPSTDRPLILVVDDNPANRALASAMLTCWGRKPLLAAGGAEAVVLACELRLDLILMDLQMPAPDGFAATAQIRRFERAHGRRRVPVVGYTSAAVSAGQA